jgi:hypothetical protein
VNLHVVAGHKQVGDAPNGIKFLKPEFLHGRALLDSFKRALPCQFGVLKGPVPDGLLNSVDGPRLILENHSVTVLPRDPQDGASE